MTANRLVRWLIGIGILLFVTQTQAQWQMRSAGQSVQLIELYTSQGCSSCPPADRWLSQWKQSPRLWKEVIPVAFHVDYWDWIGWQDRFAQPSFAQRQRLHKKQGALKSVYTPGFVVDGREWRGWFRDRTLPGVHEKQGRLLVNVFESNMRIEFEHVHSEKLQVHAAVLGFDLQTPVNKGENTNKTLAEDFVVLWYQQQNFKNNVTLQLPDKTQLDSQRLGLVVWVTPQFSSEPIQVVGNWWMH